MAIFNGFILLYKLRIIILIYKDYKKAKKDYKKAKMCKLLP